MCRQNQAFGLALLAFSAGLWIGSCVEFGFGVFVVIVGGFAGGFTLLQKK